MVLFNKWYFSISQCIVTTQCPFFLVMWECVCTRPASLFCSSSVPTACERCYCIHWDRQTALKQDASVHPRAKHYISMHVLRGVCTSRVSWSIFLRRRTSSGRSAHWQILYSTQVSVPPVESLKRLTLTDRTSLTIRWSSHTGCAGW